MQTRDGGREAFTEMERFSLFNIYCRETSVIAPWDTHICTHTWLSITRVRVYKYVPYQNLVKTIDKIDFFHVLHFRKSYQFLPLIKIWSNASNGRIKQSSSTNISRHFLSKLTIFSLSLYHCGSITNKPHTYK